MKTIIKIKTWTCSLCNYSQDCEPTQENQDKHFNNDVNFRVSNLKANQCPSCALKGIISNLILEVNLDKKITMTVMGEEDIEDEIQEIKKRKIEGKNSKNDPDVSTLAKENVHRNKRKADIQEAIKSAKLLEDK